MLLFLTNKIIMETIKIKISELKQFADIMAIQENEWLVKFKIWYQQIIRTYCRCYCLSQIANYEKSEGYYNLPIEEISEAIYNDYYYNVLKSIHYIPDKFQWWENALDSYNISKSAYKRFKGKGLIYIISNLKKFNKIKKRFITRDQELSFLDIAEIAFSRYAHENKGNLLSFKSVLKNTGD